MVVARSGNWALMVSSQARVPLTVRPVKGTLACDESALDGPDRVLDAGGCLAGGSGHGDTERAVALQRQQQGQDQHQGVGLPGAGTAGDDAELPAHGGQRGNALPVDLLARFRGEESVELLAERGRVRLRRQLSGALEDRCGEALLVFPVAVEVEPVAGIQDERLELARRADDWRGNERFGPVPEARKLDWIQIGRAS